MEKNVSPEGVLTVAKYFQIKDLIDILSPPLLGKSGKVDWETVFEDIFDGPELNTKLWRTNTHRKGAKIVTNHFRKLLLVNRVYLITRVQYKPPLRITGQIHLTSDDDSIHIVTRSNLSDEGEHRNCEEGLEFYAFKGNAGVTPRGPFVPKPVSPSFECKNIRVVGGKRYVFEVEDLGDEVSFKLAEVEEPEHCFIFKAPLDYSGVQDTTKAKYHVVFHNREKTGAPMLAFLSSIKIQVPKGQ